MSVKRAAGMPMLKASPPDAYGANIHHEAGKVQRWQKKKNRANVA
jgi:hypothetical protein